MTTFCQTCSSQLTPSTLRQSFTPPCCKTPICPACIRNNPRLREYVPCLRCGDLTTRDGESRVIKGRRAQEWEAVDRDGGDVMFDAEDDEVDDLDFDGDQGLKRPEEAHRPISPPVEQDDQKGNGTVEENEEEEEEMVEIRHTVSKADTVLTIARRYAADPHELLSLNKLPPTALSTNPRILQTRKTIIISQRKLPISQLNQITETTPEEDKRRAEERAVKRFQLVTKTVDPGVGKAYLSIQGDAPHPLENGSGEVLDKEGGAKKRGNLSKEDRAMEQWFEDDEWEGENSNRLPKKKEGKWTSVGGVKQDEKSGWFGLKG